MTEIWIRRWYIQPKEFGVDVLILDLSDEKKWNARDNEIAMCIQEQIFGDKIK